MPITTLVPLQAHNSGNGTKKPRHTANDQLTYSHVTKSQVNYRHLCRKWQTLKSNKSKILKIYKNSINCHTKQRHLWYLCRKVNMSRQYFLYLLKTELGLIFLKNCWKVGSLSKIFKSMGCKQTAYKCLAESFWHLCVYLIAN